MPSQRKRIDGKPTTRRYTPQDKAGTGGAGQWDLGLVASLGRGRVSRTRAPALMSVGHSHV